MAEKKYVTEHNCETGETIEREYTAAEYAQAELDAQAFEVEKATRLAQETALAEAKASAESKLAALGLSAEEIAAISK
jgi:hypothetical protein